MAPSKDYPPFRHVLGVYPPSGATIRSLYEDAERSTNNLNGLSNFNRYKLEIQSVVSKTAIAIDHTFQVIKNYCLKGAQAMFTMNTESGEIATVAIVESTKADQVAHLVEQMVRKREGFKPKIIYTDTWPHNDEFWAMLFGAYIVGRLGLFHLIKRIVDTLNNRCDFYWKALVSLKSCLYSYDTNDENALLTSMKNGTFLNNGKQMSEEDIEDMKASCKWKEKCDPHLRTRIHPKEVAVSRLESWLVNFISKKDAQNRPLCSEKTQPTIRNQQKHMDHISDIPSFDPYREIKPGPNSKSGLSFFLSARPEAHLELFHLSLAHFANTNMKPSLADCLTLRGITEHNLSIHHKLNSSKGKPIFEGKVPLHHDEKPAFTDHSLLNFLNQVAQSHGIKEPFLNVTPTIAEDNGEVFLSEYFHQQKIRNEADCCDPLTKRCLCPNCSGNATPFIHHINQEPVENERVVELVNKSNQMQEPPVENRQEQQQNNSPPLLAPFMPQMHVNQPFFFPWQQNQNFIHPTTILASMGLHSNCGCNAHLKYLVEKACNGRTGRPPHDFQCPERKKK